MRLLTVLLCLISISASAAMDYASVQSDRERKLEDIRNQEIRAVKTALALRGDQNRKAELYFRLAELYREAHEYDFILEGRLHEKSLQSNPSAKFKKERTVSDLQNGIGAIEMVEKLNLDPRNRDKVYESLGFYYGLFGQTEKSVGYYRKLTQEFPNSKLSFEAYRAIGEDAFSKQKFEDALEAFGQALKHAKDAAQTARIYYKIAWSHYRMKRNEDAIASMKKAIQVAQGDQEKFLSIREEGLAGIAVFYAESGRVDEAIDYFRKHAGGGDVGEEKLIKVLEKLGKEYERTGQTDKAKQVYQALLQFKRTDDSSFRVTAKMIDLDLMKQNFDGAYERLEDLVIPKTSDSDTQLAILNLKRQIRATAVNNHDRYRKMDDKVEGKKYLHVADRFYALYLNRYITDKAEKNEIRMFLAEVKKDLNNPGMSAQLYKAIIQDQDPKYAKDAAQLWIGSIWDELQNLKKTGYKPGEDPTELELDFVAASDLLEKSIPDSTESRESRLRSAQILAEYPSRKKEAIDRASKLAKQAANTPQGLLAARLWLQLQPDQAAYDAVSKNEALIASDRKGKGLLAKDLEKLGTDFKVERIKNFESSSNYLEAAKAYEDFAKNAKTEKEAENSYIGAINNYAQGKSSDDVYRVMKAWKARYPTSTKIEKTAKDNATIFLIKGMYNDAAELFLGIGRQFKDFSSYQTAAKLFAGGLQPKKAIEVYRMSLPLAANDESKAKIHMQMALIHSDLKDDLNSFNAWKDCFEFQSSLKAECGSQVGNYYLKLGDFRQGKEALMKVLAIKKGPSSRSEYLAYAQFRLALVQEKEMNLKPVQFYNEDAKMVEALQKHAIQISELVKGYEKALAIGGPWGIAAAERIGDLQIGFSEDLNHILSKEKVNKDMAESLTVVSKNAKSNGLNATKKAYELALKEGILSPALPVIHDRLAENGTSNGVFAQGSRWGIKLIGMNYDGGSLGQAKALETVRGKLLKSQLDAGAWIDYGNLLWGTGKPGLSNIAYDFASGLKTRKADALNNLAVVELLDQGYENWFAANRAIQNWKSVLKIDSQNTAALFNLGYLFNYYRLFKLSEPYFQKVSSKISISDLHDGLAVANFANGKIAEAELNFQKAEELGAKPNRFVKKYIEAGKKVSDPDACSDVLSEVSGGKDLIGFEKGSYERMSKRCGK